MQRLIVTADEKTTKWVVTPEHQAALSAALDRPIYVNYHHRSDVEEVWRETHQGRPLPEGLPPYAFRAWASNQTIHIFVDETETYDSALWVLAHELAHTGVTTSRMLTTLLRNWSERPKDYMTSDDAHEADAEEQFANQVADKAMRRLGRQPGLNRKWWRKRTPGRR